MKMNILKLLIWTMVAILVSLTGCKSPEQYRTEADKVANSIVVEKMLAVNRTGDFSIARPSNILRRRLLTDQNLPMAGPASFGTDYLKPVPHWPDPEYLDPEPPIKPIVEVNAPNEPVKLSLIQALQIGAQNSFDYQTRKEDIFRQALDLDLERNDFRTIFVGQVESLIETDTTGEKTVSGVENSGAVGVSKLFPSGVEVTADIAVTLANLLTLNQASAFGITADATVSVPLLAGSGRHIVTEPLIQAERDVVYAIFQFERFRRTFAVDIASAYLGVLRQLDVVANNRENYSGLIRSARRAKRLAGLGRLTQIQVDQAIQDELRARNNWISAVESYKSRLDSFKNLLGLPTDALIELDRSELDKLAEYSEMFAKDVNQADTEPNEILPAYAPVVLQPPDMNNAGPYELEESRAVQLAFDNRYDLKVAQGQVYDAQRKVVFFADALRARLDLVGNAGFGSNRSIGSVNSENADLRPDEGVYSALLNLDLPLERTQERNVYRNSLITLERALRDVQSLEDNIKISIRNNLRDLLESREALLIQARSVELAQKRVRSTNLFLEAGRAEIRDLLEAQESLLSAQNSLTAAIINYRIAELQLQRDMGVLEIKESGLWQEYPVGDS